MDDKSRIATIRRGDAMGDSTPEVQFVLEDHLGSSSVTLDETGCWISREEYYPFGETSFGSYGKKRYRFCGKERDEESGLYYYGARYYAPWVCRFVSIDPLAGKYAQLTPYQYAGNEPIGDIDIDGMQSTKTPEAPSQGNSEGGSTSTSSASNNQTIFHGIKPFDIVIYNQELPASTNSKLSTLQIGEYTLVPHYNNIGGNEQLVFFVGVRTEINRPELVIGPKDFKAFLKNSDDFAAAMNIYYLGGQPSQGQTAMAAGDSIKGLLQMWSEAVKSPTWWISIATAYGVTAKTLPKKPLSTSPYPAKPAVPGTVVRRTMQSGETFDRYGPIKGKWGAPIETEYGARSIPPKQTPYTKWEVVKPFKVEQSLSTPGNLPGQTGYGVQYQFDQSVRQLYKQGYIKPKR